MNIRQALKLFPLIAALTLVGAGCYGKTKTTTSTNSSATSGTSISIQNRAFSPTNLTVAKGSTVTWTNNDSIAHTVTGDTGGNLNSSTLANGGTYSYTFDTAGTYTYHCSFHSDMTGTVTVTP